jgi:hypothetical protein
MIFFVLVVIYGFVSAPMNYKPSVCKNELVVTSGIGKDCKDATKNAVLKWEAQVTEDYGKGYSNWFASSSPYKYCYYDNQLGDYIGLTIGHPCLFDTVE